MHNNNFTVNTGYQFSTACNARPNIIANLVYYLLLAVWAVSQDILNGLVISLTSRR